MTFQEARQRARAVQAAFPTTHAGRRAFREESINAQVKALDAAIDDIDSRRRRFLNADYQACIVRVHLYNLRQRLEERKTKKVQHGIRHEDIHKVTARMLGVASATVGRCWKAYCTNKMLIGYTGGRATAVIRAAQGRSRIPDSQEVVDRVRAIVRRLHHTEHRQCTALDITLQLLQEGHVDGEPQDTGAMSKKQLDAALRCVQRWLVAHGWACMRQRRSTIMREVAELRSGRATYLKAIRENREGDKLREVFTDETCVHNRDSSVRGADAALKDDRYNVLGAVMGPDLRVKKEDRGDTLETGRGGWYDAAYEKLHAPLSAGVDWQRCFTPEVYEGWFQRLCRSLREDGFQCLIVMSGAPHHKATHFEEFRKMNKEDLLRTLKHGSTLTGDNPARWDAFATKGALLEHLEKLAGLVESKVQLIAKEYGHKVVYTPPFHRDLQPMEAVWAAVKRAVARERPRHIPVSMIEVLRYLDTAVAEAVTPEYVETCYEKVVECESNAAKMVEEDEAFDSYEWADA